MILKDTEHNDVATENLQGTVKMSISMDAENESHIIRVLTENYKYPKDSLIRENFCNHWDAHLAVGKQDEPISVKLYRNQTGNYTFETSDVGVGLDETSFYKYYMGIGQSTKRENNKFIGGFGCGAKAALSYSNNYEVITRKDGKEWKFLVFKGIERPECTKIYEKDTTEPNGVTVKVPVDRWDQGAFREAIKRQLCYFSTAHIQIEGDYFNYSEAKVFGNDLFEWSEVYPNQEMHISFNMVHYAIDWDILGISKIYLPLAIKLPLDSFVKPFFNRESLMYTEQTKALIMEKIKLISEYFVEKYNSTRKEEENIITAWNKIGVDSKVVNIAGKDFIINPLLKYSSIPVKELSIKDLSLRTPQYYKVVARDCLNEYKPVAEVDGYRKWKTKWVSTSNPVTRHFEGYKLIQVEGVPTGRVKKYLLEKYSGRIAFIEKHTTRKLGGRLSMLKETDYKSMLNFFQNNTPVSEWRKAIIEYQEFVEKPFKALIKDETKVETSDAYLSWLANYKEELKNNRATYGSTGNYKTLNKAEGQITLHYCRESYGRSVYTFEKKAVDLAKLKNTSEVVIYFPIEQMEQAKKVYSLVRKKYKVALIGIREIGKVAGFNNFINYKNLETSMIFKRIATAMKFEQVADSYDTLSYKKASIIEHALSGLKQDVDILRKYVDDYNNNSGNDELRGAILAAAEENNLFDYSLWDVYKRTERNLSKYDFINCLETPDRWDAEATKKYQRLINQILYLKVKSGEIDNLDIVVTPRSIVVEESVEEVVAVD